MKPKAASRSLVRLLIALLFVPAGASAATAPSAKALDTYLAVMQINVCLPGALVDDANSNGVAMRTDLRGSKTEPDDMRTRAILPIADLKASQSPEGSTTAAYDAAHGLFAVLLSAMEADSELIVLTDKPPNVKVLAKDLSAVRTRRGLHIGSSRSEVLKVFGAPRRVAEHCGMTHYWYGMPDADINYHIVIRAGHVIALRYDGAA